MNQQKGIRKFRVIRRGFTLIEATVALVLILLIAATSTTLLTQQFTYFRILQQQNFLVQDAPVINNMLSRILSQADAFRIHTNEAEAFDGSPGLTNVADNGNTLLIGYAQADGSRLFGLLTFVPPTPGQLTGQLQFTNVDNVGGANVLGTPWILSSRVNNVDFSIDAEGILLITLQDQFQSEITYAGIASN